MEIMIPYSYVHINSKFKKYVVKKEKIRLLFGNSIFLSYGFIIIV